LVVILEVAVALGMVIFVHELGHFLVAKACGVKCEKFYLGFDIYGLKFCKLRWGETEYGIGVLPLGGYVKMLGRRTIPPGCGKRSNGPSSRRRVALASCQCLTKQRRSASATRRSM
jgi:RIP metalloprotease RseP